MQNNESLLQRARGPAPTFKKPDPAQFIPKGQEDAVQRIVAAGMKVMYSPDMREELKAEVSRNTPIPQKMAEATTGLMLMIDKKSQGGMPEAAIFPAAIGLLGEAADVLVTAGQPVSQEDFNESARLLFVLMAKKMGANDDQIMQAGRQAIGDTGQEEPEEELPEPQSGMEEELQ